MKSLQASGLKWPSIRDFILEKILNLEKMSKLEGIKKTLTKKIEKKTLQSIEQSDQAQPLNIGPHRVSGTFSEHSLKILFYHPGDVPV